MVDGRVPFAVQGERTEVRDLADAEEIRLACIAEAHVAVRCRDAEGDHEVSAVDGERRFVEAQRGTRVRCGNDVRDKRPALQVGCGVERKRVALVHGGDVGGVRRRMVRRTDGIPASRHAIVDHPEVLVPAREGYVRDAFCLIGAEDQGLLHAFRFLEPRRLRPFRAEQVELMSVRRDLHESRPDIGESRALEFGRERHVCTDDIGHGSVLPNERDDAILRAEPPTSIPINRNLRVHSARADVAGALRRPRDAVCGRGNPRRLLGSVRKTYLLRNAVFAERCKRRARQRARADLAPGDALVHGFVDLRRVVRFVVLTPQVVGQPIVAVAVDAQGRRGDVSLQRVHMRHVCPETRAGGEILNRTRRRRRRDGKCRRTVRSDRGINRLDVGCGQGT